MLLTLLISKKHCEFSIKPHLFTRQQLCPAVESHANVSLLFFTAEHGVLPAAGGWDGDKGCLPRASAIYCVTNQGLYLQRD